MLNVAILLGSRCTLCRAAAARHGGVHVADVRSQVMLSMFTDFESFTTFNPAAHREAEVNRMLDEVVAWGAALKPLRSRSEHRPVAI